MFVTVNFNGKSYHSPELSNENPGCCLSDLCQSETSAFSNVQIGLNEFGEVTLTLTGPATVIIDRYGRKRECQKDHPLMLMAKDCLWIGDNPVYRVEISKIQHRKESSAFPKSAVLASTAALMLSTTAACNPLAPPEVVGKSIQPSDNQEISQEIREVAENTQEIPQEIPQVVGEPMEIPQVVGEPPYDPENEGDPMNEPVVIGDVAYMPSAEEDMPKEPEDAEPDKTMPPPRLMGKMPAPRGNDEEEDEADKKPTDEPPVADPAPQKVMPKPRIVGKPAPGKKFPKVVGTVKAGSSGKKKN